MMATVDEIMAKVQRFGNDCIGYERSTRIFGPTAKESIRAQVHVEKSREHIRSLLAPVAPDPGLREAIADAVISHDHVSRNGLSLAEGGDIADAVMAERGVR